jgi:hypothetical protein
MLLLLSQVELAVVAVVLHTVSGVIMEDLLLVVVEITLI